MRLKDVTVFYFLLNTLCGNSNQESDISGINVEDESSTGRLRPSRLVSPMASVIIA